MLQFDSVKKTKIIVALDYSSKNETMKLVNILDPSLFYLKIGKAMFTRFGLKLIHDLHKLKFKIFLDLKFHDIPNTVFSSVQAAADLGIWMISVHISGGINMLNSAKLALKSFTHNAPMLVGITVLTSLNNHDLKTIGIFHSLHKQIFLLANLAKKCCLDGIVCSGLEAKNIKQQFGNSLKVISPGIRLSGSSNNDQNQIITPELAKKFFIDYIVIGRPVTLSKNPISILDHLNSIL
ncbi:Orotidine 5'-phosphate decarboxylase [Buchnera aphidicola (Eriosoma grossulariae)]|uniref:orotidine-5'-phosphate decarboxylase n=1 Tax=Buchnera aphidicola TaxID=9 RepID=UPI003464D587